MELKYTSRAEDYRRFAKEKTKLRIRKISIIAAFVIYVICILIGFLNQNSIEFLLIILVISVAYGGLVFLIFNIKLSYNIKKNIKKVGQPYFDYENSIVLNEDEVVIRTYIRQSKIPYNAIKQVNESAEFAVIEFKAGDMVYIPVSGIVNHDIKDDFVSLLKSKIV